MVKPKAIPPARAIAGEITPLAATRRPKKKTILLSMKRVSGIQTAEVQAEIMMRNKPKVFRNGHYPEKADTGVSEERRRLYFFSCSCRGLKAGSRIALHGATR
jgi:hypothetical protein